MYIELSEIYAEVGINFPLSYRFGKLLMKKLQLIAPEVTARLKQMYGAGYGFWIILSSRKNVTSFEIKGPSVSKRHKEVEYTVFITHDIAGRDSFLQDYLALLIPALQTVFAPVADGEKVTAILKEFAEEVLQNEAYFIDHDE